MGTIADLLNTAMRDFVRYTGDGLPNEPVGRTLPVGDPASGQFNPTKKQVRDAFRALADLADGVLEPTAEALAGAEQATAAAAQAALDRAAAASSASDAQTYRDAAEDAVQYDYLLDDDAVRIALTGMVSGERAYIRATEHVWRYNGSAWGDEGEAVTAPKANKADVAEQIGAIPVFGEDTGVNIYDSTDVLNGFYLASGTGNLTADADSAVSKFMPVVGGATYTISNRTVTGTQAVVFYDAQKIKLPASGADYEDVPQNGQVVAPAPAAFMQCNVLFNGTGNTDAVQVQLGSTATAFRPFRKYVAAENLSVSTSELNFMVGSKNLFDPKTMVVEGSLVNNGTGTTSVAAGWAYVEIPLSRDDYPFVSVSKGSSNVSTTDDVLHFFNDAGTRLGFTTNLTSLIPAGTTSMRMNISNTAANLPAAKYSFQVEYASAPTAYEPYRSLEVFDPALTPSSADVLGGKHVTWVGDSIVKADGYTGWHQLVQDKYRTPFTNKGDNAATIANIYPTVSCISGTLLTFQFSAATNICVLSGGTNDFARDLPLGTDLQMTSEDDTTVKGSLHKAITWLETNHPNADVLVFTPLERGTAASATNGIGLTLKDYRDAILEVVEAKGVSVVDNWGLSAVNRFTADKFLYDSLHPNDLGYRMSLPLIVDGLVETQAV